MAINNDSRRNDYTGNGVLKTYSYTFRIFEDTDLRVYVGGNELASNEFTVTNAGDIDGGNVVFATAPGNGLPIAFISNIPPERSVDYQQAGAFPAIQINAEFDRLFALAREMADVRERSLQLDPTSTFSGLTLPDPDAGKAVLWNADESALENSIGNFNEIVPDAEAARDAAAASESAAASSELNAGNSADLAKDWATKTSGTVTAGEYSAKKHAQDAATSAATAQAAVGGVKVSTDDTTAGILEDKLLAAGGLQLTTQNPGSNETRTITLPNSLKPYDFPFVAGYAWNFSAEDLATISYGLILVSRACVLEGEVGYLETPATGAAVVVDVLCNGTSIYLTTKPTFAISSSTMTAGVLTTTSLSAGDRLLFKVNQKGSGTAGARLSFTLKARLS